MRYMLLKHQLKLLKFYIILGTLIAKWIYIYLIYYLKIIWQLSLCDHDPILYKKLKSMNIKDKWIN